MGSSFTQNWLTPIQGNPARRSSRWHPVEVDVLTDKTFDKNRSDDDLIARLRIDRRDDKRFHYLYLDEDDALEIAEYLIQSSSRKRMSTVIMENEIISRLSERDLEQLIDLCNKNLKERQGEKEEIKRINPEKEKWSIKNKEYRKEIKKVLFSSYIELKVNEILHCLERIKIVFPEMSDDIDDFSDIDLFALEGKFHSLIRNWGIDRVNILLDDPRD